MSECKPKFETSKDPLTVKWLKYRKKEKNKPYGCIYLITNKINKKVYVGKSVNVKNRLYHYNKIDCEDQPRLYNALKKWGLDNFYLEVIDEAIDGIQLDFLEIFFIEKNNSRNDKFGYNIQGGGGGGLHSEESKKKIGDKNRGKIISEETRNKISIANTGKKRSTEVRERLRELYKTTLGSPEVMEKTRKINKGNKRGVGRKASQEAKAKMSKARKGKPLSEENKKNIGIALKNSQVAIESRKKVAEFHRGRKRSPETCKRISDKAKLWAEKKKALKNRQLEQLIFSL